MTNVQISNTMVFGWTAALRAQRNPMDSWAKADSIWHPLGSSDSLKQFGVPTDAPAEIGINDKDLLARLTKGGSEHRKAIRMIQVWATWTLPRYVWTEADTYCVAKTRMSCSTMHKLGHRDLTVEDFADQDVLPEVLRNLNALGKQYRETKHYSLVRKMKRHLPEGFLQRADVNYNYETLINMFYQRRNHRLPEWRFVEGEAPTLSLCNWIYSLPYMPDLIKEAS